ncbi:MAG: molybdenum cofactor guanylyltransferase [Candidatus Sulfotelmatobacter sp.]
MKPCAPDAAAFILAGGQSTRMGTDKAFVNLDGRPLLARMLELARSLTDDVRIVGEPARYSHFAPVVQDLYQNCGPLGGIHAALQSSATDLNLILAVDVPFVSLAFLLHLTQRARSSDASVIVVHTNERWQPLCAVYRKKFSEVAKKALRNDCYRIDKLFAETHTEVIDDEELESAGFSSRLFRNLNTPQDLETFRP